MFASLPPDWREVLSDELARPYVARLEAFVAAERERETVFPPAADVFNAFSLSPWKDTRVLILGQDPYHDDGQAHGLAFSVRSGVAIPPSLRNILAERAADLGLSPPVDGCLEAWARQGVLMLNTVLTVRAHCPGSHQRHGWETFTDAVVRALSARPERVVFVLWGRPAQQKQALIAGRQHVVLRSAHPSPLSARRGFLGSRPFSAVNTALTAAGLAPVDWRLPADGLGI